MRVQLLGTPLRNYSATYRQNEGPIKFIQHHERGGLMEAVLNRPSQLNAINIDIQQLMLSKFKEWNLYPEDAPKVLLMYGEGRAFSAGGDLKYVLKSSKTFEQWRHLFWTYQLALYNFAVMKPT